MAAASTSSQKIYLKDYQKPHFEVESTHLFFNLNEGKSLVTSKTVYKKVHNSPLVLNGAQLKLLSLKLNGKELGKSEYVFSGKVSETDPSLLIDGDLVIANTPEQFTLEIMTEIEPEKNLSFDGLYQSKGIYCTQCEAQGFRKITFFLDRPDVMTKYSVDIEADKTKYPILLSNGDRIAQKDLGNGRHQVSWRDPHKKPCYLFALVGGDLGVIKDSFTTMSGKKVNLEVYASHGKQDRCHFAMESLKKSMKWDEDTFGLEYDLGTFMIVAIDDFNMGAMENKGLNIFNSRLVLADTKTATDTDYHSIEAVVGHEYFHNWTGNRITCQNWFYLSLKEGLTVYRDQEFSSDLNSRPVQRINDVDRLRTAQFAEDAGPNAHPVRPESCMSVDNFYTPTIYEKGAEVIRMMQNLVGKKGFRKGMDTYFAKFDGQAVTTDDFAASISEPNNKDFTQFKLWYTQAGTPEVTVTEAYDSSKEEYQLTLTQDRTDAFHIPLLIGLLGTDGRDLNLECDALSINSDGKSLLELKQKSQTFVFKNVPAKPVLSLNREFSAPVNIKWNAEIKDLAFLAKHDTDSFNRRESAYKLSLNEIKKQIQAFTTGHPIEVDAAYLDSFQALIKTDLDPAFKAKMLQMPNTTILALSEPILDAEAFEYASTRVRKEILNQNKNLLLEQYIKLNEKTQKSADLSLSGERSLKNQILSLLCEDQTPALVDLVSNQYKNSVTMSDQLAAMSAATYYGLSNRQEILNHFYHQWKDDAVVLNKWFGVQAYAHSEDAFEVIQSLVKHPSFKITNPNNVYALLCGFTNNYLRFHDTKHDTYSYIADRILEIDANNPQVAARLSEGFSVAKKLKPELRARAEKQVARILENQSLSKNTRELLQVR